MSFITTPLTKGIRSYLTGKASKYVFERCDAPLPQKIEKTNLYIHIPFCKSMCPYCPYNKIEYGEKLVKPYLDAVIKEIRLYRDLFGRFEVSSIYIGGGTPTLLIEELDIVLKEVKTAFFLKGDICIETSPNDISDEMIAKLKEYNIGLVSCGVQSFQDKNLQFIGRKYQASVLAEKIQSLAMADFKSLNVDLIFALPDQGVDSIKYDLQSAIDLGVNQITTYPLFTFPYSSIGRYLRLKKVKMPNIKERKKLYYFIHNYLNDKGFKRVSVWGFKKDNVPRYSSVTRDNYIGFGAGAASHMTDSFNLNTFSVNEYINRCSSNRFPTALHMKFSQEMKSYFWLYWRFYDTHINKGELIKIFRQNDNRLNNVLKVVKFLDLIQQDNDNIELNLKGAFWIHLIQNYFSLNYINKIWSIAMREPFPEKIVL